MLNEIKNGWFSEICPMWPGRALSIEIKETLFSGKSEFQQIDVYETVGCGRMLVLDGIIQCTEQDEFCYQEMLTHLPMCSHPEPRNVLVIGGGDGGVLREIARHDSVARVDICEIDAMVVDIAKKFFPTMACGFNDPRVNLHVGDGAEFIRQHPAKYDVIIVDSSDPIGPGETLFRKPFYESMKRALLPGGIIATQGESFFLHQDLVSGMIKILDELFPVWGYAYMLVPTYPGGHIGTCIGSLGPEVKKPNRQLPPETASKLRYYTPQIHEAAFILPNFARQILREM